MRTWAIQTIGSFKQKTLAKTTTKAKCHLIRQRMYRYRWPATNTTTTSTLSLLFGFPLATKRSCPETGKVVCRIPQSRAGISEQYLSTNIYICIRKNILLHLCIKVLRTTHGPLPLPLVLICMAIYYDPGRPGWLFGLVGLVAQAAKTCDKPGLNEYQRIDMNMLVFYTYIYTYFAFCGEREREGKKR